MLKNVTIVSTNVTFLLTNIAIMLTILTLLLTKAAFFPSPATQISAADARYDQPLPTVPHHGGALDFFISNAHIDELFPGKHSTREKFTYQLSAPHLAANGNRHRRLTPRADRARRKG